MRRMNFYGEQLIGTAEMDELQQTPQTYINRLAAILNNRGVVSGLAVTPNTPANLSVNLSLGVVVTETGTLIDAPASSVDLSAFLPTTGGMTRWVSIYAVPGVVDTVPLTLPGGGTELYREDDVAVIQVTPGVQDYAPTRPVATGGFTGVKIADVLLAVGQTQVVLGNIDVTQRNNWYDIQEILLLIAGANANVASLTNTFNVYVNSLRGIVVPWAPAMTFDCSQGSAFTIVMSGSVLSSQLINYQVGQTLTFRIISESPGNFDFAWPLNFVNPPVVKTMSMNNIFQARFIVDASGGIYSTETQLWYLLQQINAVNTALGGKQATLGFVPVQQGTGVGQSNNTVAVGFSPSGRIKITVDLTDFGAVVMQSDLDTALASNLVVAKSYADGLVQSTPRSMMGTYGFGQLIQNTDAYKRSVVVAGNINAGVGKNATIRGRVGPDTSVPFLGGINSVANGPGSASVSFEVPPGWWYIIETSVLSSDNMAMTLTDWTEWAH